MYTLEQLVARYKEILVSPELPVSREDFAILEFFGMTNEWEREQNRKNEMQF